MVYHIFIDNSISDIKFYEELNFLRKIFHEEKFDKEFYKKGPHPWFRADPKAVMELYELKNDCVIIPDPLNPCWDPSTSSKSIHDYLRVNLFGELIAIQVHKLDLCKLDELAKTVITTMHTEGEICHDKILITTNDHRYDAYKDHPEIDFLSVPGMDVTTLYRKAIAQTINKVFADVSCSKELDPRLKSIRKRIYFKYMLGSTF